MELKDIDLNLLLVFRELLMERSVSGAADQLGLSQPAVSHALKRLRQLTGDDLFIRTPKGMMPTPYAGAMAEPVNQALELLYTTLNQQSEFRPDESRRKFIIGMSDLGEIEFLPRLIAALNEIAPDITISTVRDDRGNLREAMEAGQVDLAIGLLPQLITGFHQQRLFLQRYVCLFRKGHALDKGTMTQREFFTAEHVRVISEGTGHDRADEIIESGTAKRRIRLLVPHFVAIGHIVQTSEMIATVPELYALRYEKPLNLSYAAHPIDLPKVEINLFWHARYHRDPGNQWLRQLIFRLFATSVQGPPEARF